MNEDAAIQDLHRKIEREKAIINAANQMRQATNNAGVNSRVESQIRDARRNMQYFEQTLNDLKQRQMGSSMGNMSISGNGGPPPPQHGSQRSANNAGYGDYGAPGAGGYSQGGAPGMMPPRAPYAPPGPQDRSPRPKANYSKLGKSLARSRTPGC